ncbi:MAG: toprim domain-containing protein [Hymenobacter sp.]
MVLLSFRQERTASLNVHIGNNVWYDFGEGKGGDSLTLVCRYLETSGEASTIVGALRWLGNMTGSRAPINVKSVAKHIETEKGWQIKSVKPIAHLALTRYLEQRGIPLSLAQQHLKQVYAKNLQTGRSILALGLRNEEGGYELRNPFLKSSISPKTITFIRGPVPKPDSIHVFEGMMDFLSAAADCPSQQLDGGAIVLNSVSNLQDTVPYIKGYGYQNLHSWMDNDPAGEKARQALYKLARNEPDLLHQPKNVLYAPHGDVNAWRMHRLGLHQ